MGKEELEIFDKVSIGDPQHWTYEEREHAQRSMSPEEFDAYKAIYRVMLRTAQLNDALDFCLSLLQDIDKDFNCISDDSKVKLEHYKSLILK